MSRIAAFASVFFAVAILGGLAWANILYARAHPGGKDFLVPWLGMRTYLQAGESPYGEPATQRAQIQYYGRLAAGAEDPLRMNLPFPGVVLYFPLALISDYSVARGLWMLLMQAALVGLAFLALSLSGWKPGRWMLTVVLLFSLLWVYAVLCLASGNATPLVGLAIAGILVSLREGRDDFAGALLVLPFFKLDFTGIFLVFILWWSMHQYRWRVLGGFLMTLVFLLAISFIFLPSWLMPFLRGVVSHSRFNPGLTPGILFASWWPAIGGMLGLALNISVGIALFLEWRAVRGKDFRHFLWTACLTLSIPPLLGIPLHAQDYVVLFMPLVFALAILGERWSRPGRWDLRGILLAFLFLGLWLLVLGRETSAGLQAVLALPLPVLLLVSLYWMRWWATHPPRTWLDGLRDKLD